MPAIQIIEDVAPARLASFDTIIDVRSPGEFAEDHLPGAVNMPVLDDAERAQVGTIYSQESRFRARKIGAALVARNVARHLETALANRGGEFHPLIYCWRGGQRSNAMATILAQIGWRVGLLAGGYKTYRRDVVARLYDAPLPHRFVLLDGGTGSGKTELLGLAADRGAQTLDLEGLAEHRGSVFGAAPGHAQPSQKMFESRLLTTLDRLDPDRPVLVEAESSKIGDLQIPPSVWALMSTAPRIELKSPPEARARYLAAAYADVAADPAALDTLLGRLPTTTGRKRLASWRELARAGEFVALAEALVVEHYDPAYSRARRSAAASPRSTVDLVEVSPLTVAAAVDRVVSLMDDLSRFRR